MNRHGISSILALTLLMGASSPIPVPKDVVESVKGERKLVDESNGNHRSLVYSFGLPPRLLKEKCIAGDGLHVLVINGKRASCCYDEEWGEASWGVIIDYSRFESGILELTKLTSDPRPEMRDMRPEGYDGDAVPFVRTTVRIARDGACTKQERLLLRPEPAGQDRIKSLIAETIGLLDRIDKEAKELFNHRPPGPPGAVDKLTATEERFDDNLDHLRNMSVSDPDAVFKAYKTLAKDKRVDGGRAETLDGKVREVEAIKAIEKSNARDQ